jgi:splicing factor 3A subunit 3
MHVCHILDIGRFIVYCMCFNIYFYSQEAKALWEKIQARQGVNKWRPDLEEEYEDQEGNIYNKKTYTDLQRQGLI